MDINEVPEWTERAADFLDWYEDELYRWVIMPSLPGRAEVWGIRDPSRARHVSVGPTSACTSFTRTEFESEKVAKDYIRTVATEYAIKKLLDRSRTRV